MMGLPQLGLGGAWPELDKYVMAQPTAWQWYLGFLVYQGEEQRTVARCVSSRSATKRVSITYCFSKRRTSSTWRAQPHTSLQYPLSLQRCTSQLAQQEVLRLVLVAAACLIPFEHQLLPLGGGMQRHRAPTDPLPGEMAASNTALPTSHIFLH